MRTNGDDDWPEQQLGPDPKYSGSACPEWEKLMRQDDQPPMERIIRGESTPDPDGDSFQQWLALQQKKAKRAERGEVFGTVAAWTLWLVFGAAAFGIVALILILIWKGLQWAIGL